MHEQKPYPRAPSAPPQPDVYGIHKGGIRFDTTVNLTHVISIIMAVFAGFAAWSSMDKRVLVLEEARATQAVIDRGQDERNAAVDREIKETLAKVEKQLDRLNDKLDGNIRTQQPQPQQTPRR